MTQGRRGRRAFACHFSRIRRLSLARGGATRLMVVWPMLLRRSRLVTRPRSREASSGAASIRLPRSRSSGKRCSRGGPDAGASSGRILSPPSVLPLISNPASSLGSHVAARSGTTAPPTASENDRSPVSSTHAFGRAAGWPQPLWTSNESICQAPGKRGGWPNGEYSPAHSSPRRLVRSTPCAEDTQHMICFQHRLRPHK